MKLIRFGAVGKEKTGVIIGDKMYDTSAFNQDYDEVFFAENGLKKLQGFIEKNKGNLPLVPEGSRMGSPVARPSKIVAVGLNYASHAVESGFKAPSEPVLFLKATTSLCGAYDDTLMPKNATKIDWEVELAVIIGKRATNVSEENAMEHVAGYALFNDISERKFQLESPAGQWDKGKGCDTFGPLGPFMATPDEIENINHLHLWTKVNGQIMQDNNTENLIFKIPFLIAAISDYMTLLPGDIISTGTPSGVGLGFNPPIYLKEGDVVELAIDGLGVQKQRLVKL